MARRKKAARKKRVARRTRHPRLSGAKKFAIAKVHLAGVPATLLAREFKVAPLSIYLWAKLVKKAKGKNPFLGGSGGLTPKQAKLLKAARAAK